MMTSWALLACSLPASFDTLCPQPGDLSSLLHRVPTGVARDLVLHPAADIPYGIQAWAVSQPLDQHDVAPVGGSLDTASLICSRKKMGPVPNIKTAGVHIAV